LGSAWSSIAPSRHWFIPASLGEITWGSIVHSLSHRAEDDAVDLVTRFFSLTGLNRCPTGAHVRKFSIRPTLTLKGRTFKGLRGWSGKPLHPPLTDFPITAYVLAAVFDVLSAAGGDKHGWAHELWHAGTFTFIAGAAVSVFAAVSGLWDAWKSSEAGTQARRTINAHATIMLTVTVLALVDVAWRLNDYHTEVVTPIGIVVLSVVIGLLVCVGATFGGTLVYDYGFNVETAGDHPAWHKSETDVLPGHHN
jgi:uncharacterized membrane protein